MELVKRKCTPCQKGTPPLKKEAILRLLKELKGEWKVIEEHHLEREYSFKNFKEALEFTNKVGRVAEEEGHHPDIYLSWGKVKITLWTHKIGGLSENDFISAAKYEALYYSGMVL